MRKVYNQKTSFNQEEEELALAFLMGEIQYSQLRHVNGRSEGGAGYVFAFRAIRQMFDRGALKLDHKLYPMPKE